jgi:hypothetical protein
MLRMCIVAWQPCSGHIGGGKISEFGITPGNMISFDIRSMIA